MMEMGDYDQGAIKLGPALSEDRSTGRAEFRMAQIELMRGDLRSALKWAEKAATQQPGRRDIFELVAQIQTRAGNSEAAKRANDIVLSLPLSSQDWPDPFVDEARRLRVDPEYAAHRAKLLLAQGEIAQAIEIYEQLVENEPRGTQFRTELAQVLFKIGEFSRAATILEDGIKVTPGSAPVVGMLASVYLSEGRWEEAAKTYERAIALEPQFSPFHMDMGYCLLQQTKTLQAVNELDEAVKHSDEPLAAIVETAVILAEHGLVGHAQQRLRALLAQNPEYEAAEALLRSLDETSN